MKPELEHNDLFAEQGIIAACYLDRKAFIECKTSGLNVDALYSPAHKLMFQAISDCFQRSGEISPIAIVSELRKSGRMEEIGGIQYFNKVTSSIESYGGIKEWIDIVKTHKRNRDAINIATRLIHGINETPKDAEKIISTELATLNDLSATKKAVKQTDYADEALRIFERMSGNQKRKQSTSKYITTGIESFDEQFGKITIDDENYMWIHFAAPSGGKTSLARQVARHNADSGKRVIFFELETSGNGLALQMASNWAEIDLIDVRRWPKRADFETDVEYQKAKNAKQEGYARFYPLLERIRGWLGKRLWVYDESQTMGSIESQCKYLASKHGSIDLVVIDYVQMVDAEGKSWSRENEVAQISKRLKKLAKNDLKCTIMVLGQVARNARRGTEKKDKETGQTYLEKPLPQMEDLRDSGQLEQDADLITAMHVPSHTDMGFLQDPDAELLQTELRVLKRRNGRTGTIHAMNFHKPTTTFYSRNKK